MTDDRAPDPELERLLDDVGLEPGQALAAIDAFWRASILKEYFGKDFVDTYCTLKEVEADRFYAEPTTRDFEWYLRTV